MNHHPFQHFEVGPGPDAVADGVMRRVRRVHFMRRLFSPVVIKAAGMAGVSLAVALSVSIPSVVENALRAGIIRSGSYLLYAFVHTSLGVQVALVLVIGLAAWVAADAVRGLNAQVFA